MRKVLPRLRYLMYLVPSRWCPLERFRRCSLAEGSLSLGDNPQILQPSLLRICFLYFALAFEDVSSQLPATMLGRLPVAMPPSHDGFWNHIK